MPGTYSAGVAFLAVTPSFLGIDAALQGEAKKVGDAFEKSLATSLPKGMAAGAQAARPQGVKAGSDYAGAFTDAVKARLEAAMKDLPKARPDIELGEFDAKVAEMRAKLASIRDEKIDVTATGGLDDRALEAALLKMREEFKQLERDAPNVSDFINVQAARRQVEELSAVFQEARQKGFEAGSLYGGAFADAARASMTAGLKNLPEANLRADATDMDRAIADVRARMETLRNVRIGVDLDEAEFLTKIAELRAELAELSRDAPTVELRYDIDKARATLRQFAESVGPQEGQQGGDRTGGAFADAFESRLQSALGSLPKISVGADTSDADLALADVQRRLAELSSKRIGIDIDETTAVAQVEELKLRLDELAAKSPSVRVQVEAAAAAAELTAVLALAGLVDEQHPDVNVKADGAGEASNALLDLANAASLSGSRLVALIAIGAALGTVIVPAAAAAAVAIGAIGTAAGAAAAGIGVGVLGFSGISTAVQALDKGQQQAAKSTKSLSTAQNQQASAAAAVASAEASLANTRAQVASQQVAAQEQVRNADQQLTDAEHQLTEAQNALSDAYKAAKRAAEDQVNSIRDNAIAQEQAVLDIRKAKEELDKVLTNPRATQDQRDQARITFEQQTQHLSELQLQQRRLQQDKTESDRKGVEGSSQVVAAQDKIRSATEQVQKAQQALGDAQRAAADQQRQGLFQIQQAEQAVANAHRQAGQAAVSAAAAGGSALDNLRNAMAALSPAGQRFAQFLFGLKGSFLLLRDAAQGGLLPGVQRGIETLLPSLGRLDGFVGRVGLALGNMFAAAAKQLQQPIWQRFFTYIDQTAVPALQAMFTAGSNITRGLVGLYLALTPFNKQIGGGLLNLTQRFAEWATTLDSNAGYRRFLAYVQTNGPKVVDLIKQLGVFIERVVIAAAPIGTVVLRILDNLFKRINDIPIRGLTITVAAIAGLAAVMLAASAASDVFIRIGKIKKTINELQESLGRRFGPALAQFRADMAATGEAVRVAGTDFQFFQGASGRFGDGAVAAMGRIRTAADAVGVSVRGAGQRLASLAGGIPSVSLDGLFTGGGGIAKLRSGIDSVSTAMARYQTAVTTADGRVGLLAKSQELAGAAVEQMSTVGTAAMARYQTAVTTADGRVGLLAKSQELAGAAVEQMSAVGTAAMGRLQAAVTAVGENLTVLGARAGQAAAGSLAALGTAGAGALSGLKSVAGSAASAADGFIAKVGVGMSGAMSAAKTAAGGLLSALGGGWGLALAGAALGVAYFSEQAAKQKQRIDDLVTALGALGAAYGKNHDLSDQSVKDIISHNDQLSELVRHNDAYGVSVGLVAKAAEGDKDAQKGVIQALQNKKKAIDDNENSLAAQGNLTREQVLADAKQKAGIDDLITGLNKQFSATDKNADVSDKLNAAQGRAAASGQVAAQSTTDFFKSVGTLKTFVGNATPTVDQFDQAIQSIGDMAGTAAQKSGALAAVSDKIASSSLSATDKAKEYKGVLDQMGTASDIHSEQFQNLSVVFGNIATSELSASDKAALLKQALDQLYAGVQGQDQANEAMVRSQDALTQQMSVSSAGFDLHTAKTAANREAVLNNRDALKAALSAVKDKYIADIAAGETEDQARTTYDNTTKAVLNQINPTQRNTQAVQDLVSWYGKIPPAKATTVSTPGLAKAIDELVNAHAVQFGLSQHPVWTNQQVDSYAQYLQAALAGELGSNRAFKAEGGLIEGWSPTKTADNIPAWLTANEFVHPVDAVDYYGVPFMEALRKRQIPRELLGLAVSQIAPQFASGGLATWPVDIPTDVYMPVSLATLNAQLNQARTAETSGVANPAAIGAPAGTSYPAIIALGRASGIPLTVSSTYRPGDPGYHGRGEAADMYSSASNMVRLAQWFMRASGDLLELIHSGGGGYFVKNGRRVGWGFYGPNTENMHYSHVHVAATPAGIGMATALLTGANYRGPGRARFADGGPVVPRQRPPGLFDEGGYLTPGWNPPMFNGTGVPEPVVPQQTLSSLVDMASVGSGGPTTNHYYDFAKSTLDENRLRSIQQRSDALNRVDRPNR